MNAINYQYQDREGKKRVITINLAVCDEEWQEVNLGTGEIETKKSRHAWVKWAP
jgi:hypothetical protein